MRENNIELLAPAGDLETLKTAVRSGADAVYIGYGKFNARANAKNFTMEELSAGCEYAHLRSCMVYLTLNTLVYDNEMESALEIASSAYNCGVDALLIQDIGLAARIHKAYPQIPLHASTQMNINSLEDYKALRDLGIKRVVLPREFSIDEIRKHTKIAARYKIETEVFIHGAICVCYSGLCLFSGMNKSGSRSGNRGLCAQPCRQSYELYDKDGEKIKKGHLISPRDKSLTGHIRELMDAGVASLKIEGRMREDSYVEAAVSSYREIIDRSVKGDISEDILKDINDRLLISYNRGGKFTDQYFDGKKKKDFLSGEYVGKFGKLIGRVVGSEYKAGNLIIKTDDKISIVPSKGDYLSIRRHSREVSSFPVGKIQFTDGILTIKGLHPDQIKKIERGSDVFLMNHSFGLTKDNGRTHINWSCDITEEGLSLNATVAKGPYKGHYAERKTSGDSDKELPHERIAGQLSKTGNTPFTCDNIFFTDEEQPFCCSVGLINELRRDVLADLEAEILSSASHYCSESYSIFGDGEKEDRAAEAGRIINMHYFPDMKTFGRDIYRGNSLYAFSCYDIMHGKTRDSLADFLVSKDVQSVVVFPDAMHVSAREDARRAVKAFAEKARGHVIGIMDADVMSSDSFCRDNGFKHFISQGANIMNSDSLKFALQGADACAISYEVAKDDAFSMAQNASAASDEGKTIIVHSDGLIPWMQSDFCPIGANKEHCRMCLDGGYTLKQSEGGPDLKVMGRPFDHSAVIYGPSKYNFGSDDASDIASLGYDVILVKTEI